MNILALDTSMQACSVAVLQTQVGDKAGLTGLYEERERGHAERLMEMIDEVLTSSGITIEQIDQFAVCKGPGAFTGVRIGIAAARGLAMVCEKPLFGIGTLQVMAARVIHEQIEHKNTVLDRNLAIAVDARRGEVYWQIFDPVGQALGDPVALSPQSIVSMIEQQASPLALAGSGVALISQLLNNEIDPFLNTYPELQPDAARLAEIVAGFGPNENLSLHKATPLYLRPADAKIQSGYAVERQCKPEQI